MSRRTSRPSFALYSSARNALRFAAGLGGSALLAAVAFGLFRDLPILQRGIQHEIAGRLLCEGYPQEGSNQRIYVYADLDDDQLLGPSDRLIGMSTTDSSGSFWVRISHGFSAISRVSLDQDAMLALEGQASSFFGYAAYHPLDSPGKRIYAFRFSHVSLPAEAQVEQAELRFSQLSPRAGSSNWLLSAELSPHSAPLTEAPEQVPARKRSPESAIWRPEVRPQGYTYSEDIAPLLRRLIRQPGWKGLGAVTVFLEGEAPLFEQRPPEPPVMIVHYSLPPHEYLLSATTAGPVPAPAQRLSFSSHEDISLDFCRLQQEMSER